HRGGHVIAASIGRGWPLVVDGMSVSPRSRRGGRLMSARRVMASSGSSTDPVAPFDVLLLLASAGGGAAVTLLLRALAPLLDVRIVVIHHGHAGSAVVDLYRPRVPCRVEWLEPTSVLEPRTVRVCTPRTFVELLPDGTFQIRDCERGALDYPFDRLLT